MHRANGIPVRRRYSHVPLAHKTRIWRLEFFVLTRLDREELVSRLGPLELMRREGGEMLLQQGKAQRLEEWVHHELVRLPHRLILDVLHEIWLQVSCGARLVLPFKLQTARAREDLDKRKTRAASVKYIDVDVCEICAHLDFFGPEHELLTSCHV